MQGARVLQKVVPVGAEAVADLVKYPGLAIPDCDIVSAIQVLESFRPPVDERVKQRAGELAVFFDMCPYVLIKVSVVGKDVVFTDNNAGPLAHFGVIHASKQEPRLRMAFLVMLRVMPEHVQTLLPFLLDIAVCCVEYAAKNPWHGPSDYLGLFGKNLLRHLADSSLRLSMGRNRKSAT